MFFLPIQTDPIDRRASPPCSTDIPDIPHSHLLTYLSLIGRRMDGCVYLWTHTGGHTPVSIGLDIVYKRSSEIQRLILWWRMMIVVGNWDRGCSHYLDPTPTAEWREKWHFIALGSYKCNIKYGIFGQNKRWADTRSTPHCFPFLVSIL